MRVLVTGGSGRIGQAVVRDLVGQGYEVLSADQRRPASWPTDHRFVETDLGDVGHDENLLDILRGLYVAAIEMAAFVERVREGRSDEPAAQG